MRAGSLRHRVEIQSDGGSQDATGQKVPSWSTTATVWASIEPVSGREYLAAGQFNAEVSHFVVMRYDSTITVTPANRLKFGSRYFAIISVRNVEERGRMLELGCKEGI